MRLAIKQSKTGNPIVSLKKHISKLSSKKDFPHHEWFVKFHLKIAEKIALELCTIYPSANRDLVVATVWFHDYGKLIDFRNEHTATEKLGLPQLIELGFDNSFAIKVMKCICFIDRKKSFRNAPIEAKIASSADGASHLVGPFFSLYWRENPKVKLRELMIENKRKLLSDWHKKIVLPEVRKAFKGRYLFLEEYLLGKLPVSFNLTKS